MSGSQINVSICPYADLWSRYFSSLLGRTQLVISACSSPRRNWNARAQVAVAQERASEGRALGEVDHEHTLRQKAEQARR